MIIIGAGSAGLFLSEKQIDKEEKQKEEKQKEKHKEKTIVIEEHKKLGQPVQCTGILTDEINKLIKPRLVDKFTLNKITTAKIYSPNNSVELRIKKDIIIDNIKFIEHLAEQAEKKDVKIQTNHRYLSNTGNEIKVRNLETNKIKIFRDSELVGADGPRSNVSANNNLDRNNNYLLGIQARIKIKDLDKNKIEFYPHLGEYAWSVPENDEISRVGIAIPLENQKSQNINNLKNKMFEDFLKKYPGKKIEIQAGLIPLHKPKLKISSFGEKFSVALLGDAAGQIKNTTGGGIIPGLKAAEELSKGIENYHTNLKKINRELYLHYVINRILRNYKDKDWDRLILKVKNDKIKHALENTNRDNVTRLLLSLARSPSMISEGLIALTKIR